MGYADKGSNNVIGRYTAALILCAVTTVAILLLAPRAAHAVTLQVAAGTDGLTTNDICQLSEALENINDQAQTHADCGAGDGNNDTIELAEGTIALIQDLPTVSGRPIVIRGAGADKTIVDGADQYLGFTISDPQTVALVEDMHIKRTRQSHAVAVTGLSQEVTIRQIELSEVQFINSAIFVTGSYDTPHETDVLVEDIYIHDSSVDYDNIASGPAAAIFSQFIFSTEMTARRVTISNNQFAVGFSISLAESDGNGTQNSVLNLENNTVAMNESADYNTGMGNIFMPIFATGYGDMLASVNIKNNTIVNNNSVIDEIEGAKLGALGIYAVDQGKVIGKVQNNILAGNTFAGNKASCLFMPMEDSVIDIESLGHNIADDATCGSVFTEPGDQNSVDTAALQLQPLVAQKKNPITLASMARLATFQYDGSFAPVIALGTGSIAIDSGDCNNAPNIDQRFVVRPQGITCDVGSYEAVLAAVTTPGTTHEEDGGQLASTGILTSFAIAIGAVIVFVAIATYVDYRRHRQPLYEEDPNVDYTYLHHIRVVTIPLAKYRISLTLQRNSSQSNTIHRI